MGGRALLSRIAGVGPVDEVESIVAHVRVLLNTRLGEAPCAPTLGVPDFADLVHAMPGGIPQLAAAMRSTLLEHEPRLRSVAVRALPGDGELLLRFEIVAHRAAAGPALKLFTSLSPGGRFHVSA
jgi:type VI secretion system protein